MYILVYNLNNDVNKMFKFAAIITICFISVVDSSDYFVELSSNSPVVIGGTVDFTAQLKRYDGSKPVGDFRYDWEDNTSASNSRSIKTKAISDMWNVTYPVKKYSSGSFEIQVSVYHYLVWIYFPITTQRLQFNLTDNLNGRMDLKQGQINTTSDFVANSEVVIHEIALSKADADYLTDNATSVLTYWFIDCTYFGVSSDFKFSYNYTKAETEHSVEAFVVAGYEPITTPAPSTTTPKPTTSTSPPTTTTKATTTKATTTTTEKPKTTTTTSSTTTLKPKVKREASTSFKSIGNTALTNLKGAVPYDGPLLPLKCSNFTSFGEDHSKTYGYFSRKITVKAPVANVNVTGNNWIPHSELLDLNVTCTGSAPYYYCVDYRRNDANNTNNETCSDVIQHDTCNFVIKHYFSDAREYTLHIIVYNKLNKVITPVLVTVYKAIPHAQLSVIVVPVTCCLAAVVLIIFGIAYYIQNRSRFIVEVADFNFGQQYTDLEYKTFRERLRDSVSNAFIRDTMPEPNSSSGEPNSWPPGRKYGSMTN